jgi:hypothetical protein
MQPNGPLTLGHRPSLDFTRGFFACARAVTDLPKLSA